MVCIFDTNFQRIGKNDEYESLGSFWGAYNFSFSVNNNFFLISCLGSRSVAVCPYLDPCPRGWRYWEMGIERTVPDVLHELRPMALHESRVS